MAGEPIDHAEAVRLLDLADKTNRERIAAQDRRIDERFAAMEKQTSLALTMSDKAISKAEIATERRLDLMNEFRSAMGDQQSTYLTKSEYEVRHRELQSQQDASAKEFQRQISFNTTRLDRLDGMTTGLAVLGAIITILTVVDLISRFIKP